MSKILYVETAVQQAALVDILIPAIISGFWSTHRPAGHGDVFKDVAVLLTTDGQLGPVGFEGRRNYDFKNLDFRYEHEKVLLALLESHGLAPKMSVLNKLLVELGIIVNSRKKSVTDTPIKIYRGNHCLGTITTEPRRVALRRHDARHVVLIPIKPNGNE
jgi:hypothetical protein